MKALHAILIGSVGLCTLSLTPAHAQEDTDETLGEDTEGDVGEGDVGEDESADPDPEGDGGGEAGEDNEESADTDKGDAAAGADADTSPVELPGKSYHFVGLRYRGIVVPQFMINMFGEGGKTVFVNSFGPEYVIRKDGFEYDFALWLANYSMDPTPFKAKDDPVDAWEIVESKMKVLFLTADFLWSHDFTPEVALNYGGGGGLGIVFGDLIREQATPSNANPNQDPEDWVPCAGPGQGIYCGDDNDHYNGYKEPNWANGGSKPLIFPWFAIQTGLRYKPHKKFVGRLDVGFGTSGFFFGIGADYGL